AGHVRSRPMMLRPVELNPAADPRSGQTHQRRLDHILAVDEVVSVGLVHRDMDSPADLRKDHHTDVSVFDVNRIPRLVARGFFNAIVKRQRIDLAAAALVDAALQEHRILIRRVQSKGANGDRLPPRTDSRDLIRRTLRQLKLRHAMLIETHANMARARTRSRSPLRSFGNAVTRKSRSRSG